MVVVYALSRSSSSFCPLVSLYQNSVKAILFVIEALIASIECHCELLPDRSAPIFKPNKTYISSHSESLFGRLLVLTLPLITLILGAGVLFVTPWSALITLVFITSNCCSIRESKLLMLLVMSGKAVN